MIQATRPGGARRGRGKGFWLWLLLLPLAGAGLWSLLTPAGEESPNEEAGSSTAMESSAPLRRVIYDRNFNELALSFRLSSIYARPLEIADPEGVAARLAGLLKLDRDELLASFKSERSFVWVARQASKEAVAQVAEDHLPGVYVIHRAYRYYPHHEVAAHAVGFVKDDQGLAGIEAYYDTLLRGGVPAASLAGLPAAAGEKNGHLVSALDLELQKMLEKRLSKVLRESGGRAGTALVMATETGAIRAMVSLPAYDLNRFWAFNADERNNRALSPQVHPGALGSLFQLATAGIPAASSGLVTAPAVSGQGESGGAAAGWWREVRPGVYASPELGELAARAAALPLPQEMTLALGVCGPPELDLPEAEFGPLDGGEVLPAKEALARRREECRELFLDPARATVSGVGLLTGFSRLLTGERAIAPHLVEALWDGENRWPVGRPATGRPEAPGQRLTPLLAGQAGVVASRPLFFETLIRLDDQREAAAAAREMMLITAQEQGLAGAEATVAEQDATEPEANGAAKYHAVMLAASAGEQPALTMLLMVDQVRQNPEQPSLLRALAREVLDRPESWLKAAAPPDPHARVVRETALYRQWLSLHQEPEFHPHVAVSAMSGDMPNVLGMSLRKALQVLQQSGLRLKVHGSGQVVAQHPAPGAPLKGVKEGRLELRVAAYASPGPNAR